MWLIIEPPKADGNVSVSMQNLKNRVDEHNKEGPSFPKYQLPNCILEETGAVEAE